MRKPLLLYSRGICKGPIVEMRGLAMVSIEGMDGLDVIVLRITDDKSFEEDEIKRFTGDGEFVIGLVDGWLQAERVATSGGRVDVFVEDIRGPVDTGEVQKAG